jgi:sodium/bile acid cotransporter 7
MKAFFKRNWFVFGIVGAVASGLLVPSIGLALDKGGGLSAGSVVAIFVVLGLALPSEEIRLGVRNFRVHLLLHVFIFVVAPAYFVLTSGWLRPAMDGRLLPGIYALAVLPTTVSSCIVLTQMARGNVTTAIFNAVLTNMAGVFISPLLLTLLLRGAGRPLPADQVIAIFLSLAAKVLLPFAVGQVLRLRLHAFATRHRTALSSTSGALILVVVFAAFCKAAGNESLRANVAHLPVPLAYLAGSNILLMALAYLMARLLRLAPADVVAVAFTAPQKTIAVGVPLITTYFASQPDLLGIALLPILFYHPWQLVTAGLAKGFLTLPEPLAAAGKVGETD